MVSAYSVLVAFFVFCMRPASGLLVPQHSDIGAIGYPNRPDQHNRHSLLDNASGEQEVLPADPDFDERRAFDAGPLMQSDFDTSEAMNSLSSGLKKRLGRVQKHTIYFLGDSLIRNQYAALCATVSSSKVPDIGLGHDGFLYCDSKFVYAVYFYSETFATSLVNDAISKGHPVPSIIYMHVGAHLLHLHPARSMNLQHFSQLYNYTGMLADVLTSFQQSAPLAQMNVMTTFSICESMLNREWADIANISNENPSLAAQPCATAMTQEGIDSDVAQRVCEKSFFTRTGSMYIREQVLQTVSNLKGSSKVHTVVADMWKLTDGHCDMCDDGRHYNRMVLNQLDAFFTVNNL